MKLLSKNYYLRQTDGQADGQITCRSIAQKLVTNRKSHLPYRITNLLTTSNNLWR